MSAEKKVQALNKIMLAYLPPGGLPPREALREMIAILDDAESGDAEIDRLRKEIDYHKHTIEWCKRRLPSSYHPYVDRMIALDWPGAREP